MGRGEGGEKGDCAQCESWLAGGTRTQAKISRDGNTFAFYRTWFLS